MDQPTGSRDEPFSGRHFAGEVIVLCVRWYITYKLVINSRLDLVEMLAGRGSSWPHTTVLR